MENAVSVQTIEFLYSSLLGIGLGVFYDFLRTVRTFCPKRRMVVGLFDALFWVCAIIALFAFVLVCSGGKMRFYLLFGVFCGAFVYRAAASEIVAKVMSGTVNALIKIMRAMTSPVLRLLSYLGSLGRKSVSSARKATEKRRRKKGKADRNGSKKKKKEKHIS